MFYDISDVCRLFRLSPNSVRYYESLGLIHPARTSGGRRKYSVEEMCMLLRIKSLQKLGLDLQTIKEQFIDETPFLPEMLFDIMEGKIAQMEQQIRCLQSSVSMLRQYEQRLQEADVSLDQPHTVDLPDIYFLPMDPLFGRSAAEREALAQWLDAIPMMRKIEYYRAKNAGGGLFPPVLGILSIKTWLLAYPCRCWIRRNVCSLAARSNFTVSFPGVVSGG